MEAKVFGYLLDLVSISPCYGQKPLCLRFLKSDHKICHICGLLRYHISFGHPSLRNKLQWKVYMRSSTFFSVRSDRPTEEEVIIEDAKPKNLRLVSEDLYAQELPSPSYAGAHWGQKIQLLTVQQVVQ